MTAYVPGSSDSAAPGTPRSGTAPPAPARRQGAFADYFSVGDRRRVSRRYGRFVGVSKFLLVGLAAALMIALAVWPQITRQDNRVEIGIAKDVAPEDVVGLRVTRAQLTGVSADGQPYNVTFDTATQTTQESDLVTITAPQADVELKDGAWVALSAEKGRYHRENRIMELDAPVQLFHDSGLEIATGSMTFDLMSGAGAGHDPLHAQAPFGQLDSQGFRIREEAGTFRFIGPVRAVLYGPPRLAE